MFTSLKPQRVQHDSGYIVQTGGQFSLQYLNEDLIAGIAVDNGPVITGLYPESMTLRRGKNAPLFAPTLDERDLIMGRIISALDFWKMKYEILKGRPFNT
jgi:hypothetical protein